MKGSITIFLSLCLTICITLICTVLEAARLQGLRFQLDMAADSALDSVFAGYDKGLLDQYGLLFLDGGFGNKDFSEEMLKKEAEEYLKYELQPSCDQLLAGTTLYPMKTEELELFDIVRTTDFGGSMFAQEVVDYMKYQEVGDLVKKLAGWTDTIKDGKEEKQEVEDAKTDMENRDWNEVRTGNENTAGVKMMDMAEEEPGDHFDQERYEKELEKSVIHKVEEVKKNGFWKFVIPPQFPISSAVIEKTDFPSEGETEPLSMENQNIVEKTGRKVLYNEYLLGYFPNCLEKRERNGAQYELEYIIFGKESDEDNLKACINRLLWIREGLNIAHIFTSPEKMEQALALASSVLGWTLLPPLVSAAQLVIVGAWAYGESLLDVRHLLGGKKVELVKTDQTWNLSLSGLGDFLEGHISEKQEDSGGLGYKDYLRILLFLQEPSVKYYRTMDMIQINICETKPGFRMKNCVYAMELSTKAAAKSLFFALPIVSGTVKNDRDNYEMTAQIGRNY